jgi:ABC-type microcin C transport system duplicated ATPase subunit YejF
MGNLVVYMKELPIYNLIFVLFTEPKGSVQPRITVEKHVTRQVKVGDDITLPCVAQGFPVPSYR